MNPIRRAQLAQQIYQNELWPVLREEFKQSLFEEFCNSTDPIDDERIRIAKQIVDYVFDSMLAFIQDGTQLKIVGDNDETS